MRQAGAAAAMVLFATTGAEPATQPFPNLALYATTAQMAALQATLPSLAPVQSVNGATGAVAVPAFQREVSLPLTPSAVDGTLTWAFPVPFATTPTCFASLAATATSYAFDFPVQTSISTTAVSFTVTAHLKTVTIASLTLPIVLQITPAAPPAGTTLTLSCIAPM